MEKLISVIIPVYNHTEHLQEVLDALVRQTYRHIEILVVDDGSRIPISKENFLLPPNFQIFWFRQENSGASAARNFGFSQSKGEYVFFCDADVVVSLDILKRLCDGLERDLAASYAYSDHYYGFKRFLSRSFDSGALKKNNYITTMSLIRREDFFGFDPSIKQFQDWDLWLTMLEQGKRGIYVPGFLWRAYPHRGGISSWLPKIAYRLPWKYFPLWYKKVKAYERSKRIVQEKHHLI